MNELAIYKALKEAYETSTQNNNRFLTALLSVPWDDIFEADGEHYFSKGSFFFTTPSLDPFAMRDKPTAVFSDGSTAEF